MGLFSDAIAKLQKGRAGGTGFPVPVDAGSALMPKPEPVEQGGLMGFMRQAQQPGGFVERLGDFGANLQDIDNGGDRLAQREEARNGTAEEQEAARQREQVNMLAKSLKLSPQDQLFFNVNPEGFMTAYGRRQDAAAEAEAGRNEETYIETPRGIYRTGPNAGWAEQFEPEPPRAPEGMRWTEDGGLELIPGYVEGRSRVAGATRAPPRPRAPARPSSRGNSPAPVNPGTVRWD